MNRIAVGARRGGTGRGRATIALLLGLCVFGLYGVTAGDLVGYEGETTAVSEGLVTSGQLRMLSGSPLSNQGIVGRGGYRYSRTGLTQPLLEAPFYWLGDRFDQLSSDGHSYRSRLALLRLYDPLMAALTVVAIFALLVLRGVSDRKAVGVAALAAVATLIWPYSKIGMDTTFMTMIAGSVLTAAWAAARPTVGRFALAGVVAALAANTKPYGAALALGVLPLLVSPLRALPKEQRRRCAAAFLSPLVAGLAAVAWYNWYRTGSVTDFGNFYVYELLATPVNAIGLFLSPGKGLLLYSPLVILGLLGLPTLWRADRPLTLTIVLIVAINTLVIAASAQWGDETWGPRYLVPSAWLLVLPIAWWAKGSARIRSLAVVAALGTVVALAGVIPRYYVSVTAARALAAEPVYLYGTPGGHVAYGDDGPRWVPEASPLLFQIELVAAYAKEQLTGSGFVVSYTPFRGNATTIDLRHPDHGFGPLPDFWWAIGSRTPQGTVLALLLAALAIGCGTRLALVVQSRTRRSVTLAA